MNEDPKPALKAKGVLGPLVAIGALAAGAFFGVEIDEQTQQLLVGQAEALIVGGLALAGSIVGIYGRIVARQPIGKKPARPASRLP